MNPGRDKLSADGPTEQKKQKFRYFCDVSHQEANLGACDREVLGSFGKNPVVSIF